MTWKFWRRSVSSWRTAKPGETPGQMDIEVQFPHCDQAVLHAPAECKYCDMHSDWQQLRIYWGIAFTGHLAEKRQLPCPSDFNRGLAGAHIWAGNIPRPDDDAIYSSLGDDTRYWADPIRDRIGGSSQPS